MARILVQLIATPSPAAPQTPRRSVGGSKEGGSSGLTATKEQLQAALALSESNHLGMLPPMSTAGPRFETDGSRPFRLARHGRGGPFQLTRPHLGSPGAGPEDWQLERARSSEQTPRIAPGGAGGGRRFGQGLRLRLGASRGSCLGPPRPATARWPRHRAGRGHCSRQRRTPEAGGVKSGRRGFSKCGEP